MTFEELSLTITNLSKNPNLDFFVVGQSTLGQPIYGVHLGSYEGKQILIEGGIHAREYPITLVVVKMIEYMTTQNFETGGVYAIPLSNPDGARIVLDGTDWIKCEKLRNYILDINDGSDNFDMWKADAMAVDLNVNGYYPESEREVRTLIDFSYRVRPDLTLSYHTKGDVIYYGFELLSEKEQARDKQIAEYISTINGYTPVKTVGSVGGYSDWAGEYLKVPAFTIEIAPASVPTPVPLEYVEPAFEANKDVPKSLIDYLQNMS